jgi:hypothetical protein
MNSILLETVVAALRDTASKTLETKSIERAASQYSGLPGYSQAERPYEVEAFSRDWIAGRLLGMADTIEAVSKSPAPPSE